jgi:hypothetical protein
VAQSGSALGWGPSGRRFKSGRPDSPAAWNPRGTLAQNTGLFGDRTYGKAHPNLDTIYLLLGIVGFMALIAAFFFGGFVLLDFIWGRRGGDL